MSETLGTITMERAPAPVEVEAFEPRIPVEEKPAAPVVEPATSEPSEDLSAIDEKALAEAEAARQIAILAELKTLPDKDGDKKDDSDSEMLDEAADPKKPDYQDDQKKEDVIDDPEDALKEPSEKNAEDKEEELKMKIDYSKQFIRALRIIAKAMTAYLINGPSKTYNGSELLPEMSSDDQQSADFEKTRYKESSWTQVLKGLGNEKGGALYLMRLALALNEKYPPMKLIKPDEEQGKQSVFQKLFGHRGEKTTAPRMSVPRRLAIATAK